MSTEKPCLAWDAEFYSLEPVFHSESSKGRGWEHKRAIYGPEKEVRKECRKFAKAKGVKRWSLKPRPTHNGYYEGKIFTTPPTALLKPKP